MIASCLYRRRRRLSYYPPPISSDHQSIFACCQVYLLPPLLAPSGTGLVCRSPACTAGSRCQFHYQHNDIKILILIDTIDGEHILAVSVDASILTPRSICLHCFLSFRQLRAFIYFDLMLITEAIIEPLSRRRARSPL